VSNITTADKVKPATLVLAPGTIREFTAVVNDAPLTGNFSQPVTITIPYPDTDNDGLVDGSNPPSPSKRLAIYLLNETTLSWEQLTDSTVDTVDKTVSVPVNHFSVYGVFANTAFSLGSVNVFPNPYKPGSGSLFDAAAITFDNIPDQSTIRIYTLMGDQIKEMRTTFADANQKLWDTRNEQGKKVASGVYFYLITTPEGTSHKGRVAIVR